jgi:hypothetical protein
VEKLCECGCGAPTRPAGRTDWRRLSIKGEPVRFRPGHQAKTRGHTPPIERVFARLDMSDPDACWVWPGSKNDRGYGNVGDGSGGGKQTLLVHRLVYEALVGSIPEGLTLDHLCRNPPCVNPLHLEPVTHRENCRRAAGEFCKRGHPFDDANTIRYLGRRQCRICANEGQRRRYWAARSRG